jgi:hypothetical protein
MLEIPKKSYLMETSVKRIAYSDQRLQKRNLPCGRSYRGESVFQEPGLNRYWFLGRRIIKRHWIQEYLPAIVFSTGRFRRLKTGGDG